MTIPLDRAVLEITTDQKQLDAGLAQVRDKLKGVDAAARDVGTSASRSFQAAGGHTTAWAGQLKSLATTIGVTFSVGALVGFGRELLRMGDSIQKAADQASLTTEEVQRLNFVADQSGVSFEGIVSAVQNLQQRLGEGDAGAVGGLKALGIKTKDFLALSPYEQFLRISEGAGKIENPMKRAALMADLFGKNWKEIGPAVTAEIRAIADAAPVMSDKTVKALDAAGDAWSKFTLQIKVWAAESYNWIGRQFDLFIANFYDRISALYVYLSKASALAAKILPSAAGGATAAAIGTAAMDTAKWFHDAANGIRQQGNAAASAAPKVQGLFTTTADAKAAAKALAEQYRQNLKDAARQEATEQRYTELLRETEEALTDATRSSIQSRVAQSQLHDELHRGAAEWLAYQRALELAKGSAPLLGVTGGSPTDQLPLTSPIPTAPQKAPGLLAQMFGSAAAFGQSITQSILGAIQGGGNVGQAAGGAIGSSVLGGVAKKLTTGIGDTAAKVTGWMGGALNAALPVLGSLLGSFGGKLIEKIVGAFDRDKGRDVVEAFAKSLGGFDALHAKLGTLGAEGERLWVRLTQGVGRNDPKAAQAAVDAVTAALDRQATALTETKGKVSSLVQAHLGASTQITPALQAQIDQLVEMGVITADNAAEMLNLTKGAGPGFDQVKAAADRLGIGLDGVGAKVANMAFAAKVDEVSTALKTMEEAGADMGAVFAQSAEKVQPLVSEAIKFGKEMPDAMRPYLEKMVEAGLLTDENGTKLTDLSKVKFAEPLTKKFDDLIVKIGELVDALTNGVGGALTDLGNRTVRPTIAPRFVAPDGGLDIADLPGVTPMARGGFGRITTPTLFWAGEHGPEDFAFSGANRSFAALRGRSLDDAVQHITVKIGERAVARATLRGYQREAQILGV